MKKSHFAAFILSASLASIPVCSFAAPQDRPQEQQDHKAAQKGNYHFRTEDRGKLQQHYRAAHPQRTEHHNWAWHRGVNLPSGWQGQVEPLPQADITLLAPAPAGYVFGYYDGWAIVYDPNTGMVLDAVLVE